MPCVSPADIAFSQLDPAYSRAMVITNGMLKAMTLLCQKNDTVVGYVLSRSGVDWVTHQKAGQCQANQVLCLLLLVTIGTTNHGRQLTPLSSLIND